MAGSTRKINYGLRPAKNIERKMMRDMFTHVLSGFNSSEYKYIGFGSKYFIDFILFHKTLHISKMISIEADRTNRDRYTFNKPYSCIEVKTGLSSEVLPKLIYEERTISWLDYDSRFNKSMLEDLDYLTKNSKCGSIICLSYNCEPYKPEEKVKFAQAHEVEATYKNLFESIVGRENIPVGFSEQGWGKKSNFSLLLKNSVFNQVKKSIQERNNSIELESDKLKFEQIMYFDYSDQNQSMNTICFIIYSENEVSNIGFEQAKNLKFFNDGDVPYEISVPNFTFKEIRYLMEKMPAESIDTLELNPRVFDKNDVEKFIKYYKYFPSFNEMEIM